VRVCDLHREQAIDTFISLKDKTEHDLCKACKEMVLNLLETGGQEQPKAKRRRRTKAEMKSLRQDA
jgi:hypothetical protein